MVKSVSLTLGLLISLSMHGPDKVAIQLDLAPLKNPVRRSKDNLRDPPVRPAQPRERQYRMHHSHFELVCHTEPPETLT
jgi:hypothetical protein